MRTARTPQEALDIIRTTDEETVAVVHEDGSYRYTISIPKRDLKCWDDHCEEEKERLRSRVAELEAECERLRRSPWEGHWS